VGGRALRGWRTIYAGLDLRGNFSIIIVADAQGKEVVKQRKLVNNGDII
jgi:hypothetical protein